MFTYSTLLAASATAASFSINDMYTDSGSYWGGHSYFGSSYLSSADLIGPPEQNEISQVDVDIINTQLNINIHSVAMSHMANNPSACIGLGDLFLSNDGWHPNTDGTNNQYDTPNNGEDWEFVLVFDDHKPSTPYGTFGLFAVSDENNIIHPEDILDPANGLRAGQEVRYDTSGQIPLSTAGTWLWHGWDTLSTDDDYLTLSIFYDFASLSLVENIGIHFAMSCANDVVEGGDEIPEPVSMVLFGTGLAGIGGGVMWRRRKE